MKYVMTNPFILSLNDEEATIDIRITTAIIKDTMTSNAIVLKFIFRYVSVILSFFTQFIIFSIFFFRV